ncbi:MAG: hypothetical protein H6522_11185 [Mycolicibacterium sp.]|nr:hypothetical protein [Mycolicibacterium sp.]
MHDDLGPVRAVGGLVVSHRQSRRMAPALRGRRRTPPQRIREIAMGRPATEDESVDVLCLTVTQLLNEKRRTKRGRVQRRCTRGLIMVAATIIALNALLCLGLVLFILTQHTSPY